MRYVGLATVVLCAWTVLATTAVASEQRRSPHRWWKSDEVKAMLELREDQSAQLEESYGQSRPKQRESWRRLNAEERSLSKMIADMTVSELDVTRQVDRVEAARSELRKTRTLMVFRMYRVLSSSQRTTLKKWWEGMSKADDPSPQRRC